MIKNKRIILF